MIDWIVGIGTLYLLWQQNQIFKQQNKIFDRQEGRDVVSSEHAAKLRVLARYWPMLAMAVMTCVVGFDIYLRHRSPPELPEFDAPAAIAPIRAWGLNPDGCYISITGEAFARYANEYRAVPACLVDDGSTNRLDVPIQVGNAHDIVPGIISMRIPISNAETLARLSKGPNFLLILLPKNIQITQFSNLGQARKLGAKIKLAGAQGLPP